MGDALSYLSTRGADSDLSFADVVLKGLASDGGLYVPSELPRFSKEQQARFAELSYADLATEMLKPFVGDALDTAALNGLLTKAYGDRFRHAALCPLNQIGEKDYLLELFHGPTLAFKDFALQVLGLLFDAFASKAGRPLTILGATSGDTGSAAIEACRGRKSVRIVMLHPEGRVSDVQRRQMTTIVEDNVVNLAVDGSFDDCQALVKAAFMDGAIRQACQLTAVNSINWARVVAQTVYYARASLELGGTHPVHFSVPTGNFGDIYAGYLARLMGFPVGDLVIATNRNDILVRTLETGRYDRASTNPTLSPSMDISVASNFERYLLAASGNDTTWLKGAMEKLKTDGGFELPEQVYTALKADFKGAAVSDQETIETIRDVYANTQEILDPHTAIGVKAFEKCDLRAAGARVTLATAHPAKFEKAVEEALDQKAPLPNHLEDLMDRPERMTSIPADLDAIRPFLSSVA